MQRQSMMPVVAVVAGLGLFPFVQARGQADGVATFVMRSQHGQQVDTVVQTSRGKSLRMEGFGGAKGDAFIIDADKGRMIMLDPAKKTAMVLTREDQERMTAMGNAMMGGQHKPADRARVEPVVTRTGRTETVAGIRCEVYHLAMASRDKNEDGDVCLGEVGFGIFQVVANNPMFRTAAPQEWDQFKKLVSEGKGLMKATANEDGKSLNSLELIRFERKSVPASAFDPPAGYEVQSMGNMLNKASGALEQLQKLRPKRPPL